MQAGRDEGRAPLDGDGVPVPTCGSATSERAEEGLPAIDRPKRLIAIVEDDDTLAMTFRQALEEERGWSTMVVGDGEEALHVLPAARPDMILLDMTLPGLDGVSLYRMLRGRRETLETPILIVTASHEWELQRRGLEPLQLLRKPFDLDDLFHAIESLLQDVPSGAATRRAEPKD
jgi:two-component system, chemotaxis family, chemotaxis protein CheY